MDEHKGASGDAEEEKHMERQMQERHGVQLHGLRYPLRQGNGPVKCLQCLRGVLCARAGRVAMGSPNQVHSHMFIRRLQSSQQALFCLPAMLAAHVWDPRTGSKAT